MKYTVFGIATIPVFQHIEAPTSEHAFDAASEHDDEWEFQTLHKMGRLLTREEVEFLFEFLGTLQITKTGVSDE